MCCTAKDVKRVVVSNKDMATSSSIHLVVLGIAQDAGYPQVDCQKQCCAEVWADRSQKKMVSSLGVRDPANEKVYVFDATPDLPDQLQLLKNDSQVDYSLAGIFLTHAHIGHYTGLMQLGREVLDSKQIPTYVMPRMYNYLSHNGPWDNLVKNSNVELQMMADQQPIALSSKLHVTPLLVPHRDEYSETVGFIIRGPQKSTFFLPDIDGWDEWESLSGDDWIIHTDDVVIRDVVKQIDYAFLDATFYDDNELPGRDMSQIPHPRVTESMDLMDASEDESLKDKIRFIHINHTNPLRDKASAATQEITKRGYKLARRGERFCL